jgi:cupin 2 domain-containing protein
VAKGRRRRARFRGLVNLLRDLPDARTGEVIETILAAPGVRIERIVSLGQASPPGFWYDQPEAEWVLLLAGGARLRFADEAEARVLGPGDCVHIAAHRRHRVDWTDPDRPTVWLAVFHTDAESDQNRPVEKSASRTARST